MRIDILPDANAVAQTAARFVAEQARAAVAARGRFLFAVSGGHAPWIMLRHLAKEVVPWAKVHLFQVDERIAPAGDPDRNLTHLKESLLDRVPLPASQVYAMPVEAADLEAAAKNYSTTLKKAAGSPAVLDLIHLGLGPDGHTASLVPGDPVLNLTTQDVGLTGIYQGRRRMTLTYPVLNRARQILWLITGSDKVMALAKLRQTDPAIPAGRVRQDHALALADAAAAQPASPQR